MLRRDLPPSRKKAIKRVLLSRRSKATGPAPDVVDAVVARDGSCRRDVLAEAMTEDELMANVRDLAHRLGLATYHTHDSRRSEPGWPDLAIVGRRLLLRELKTETGRLRPEQKDWIANLGRAGVDTDVWRPSDWRSGRIAAELTEVCRG